MNSGEQGFICRLHTHLDDTYKEQREHQPPHIERQLPPSMFPQVFTPDLYPGIRAVIQTIRRLLDFLVYPQ